VSETATIQVQSVKSELVGKEKKRTIWKLTDGNGKVYSTFKAELGNSAIGFEGGPAKIEFTEEQKGEWTNRYLESIAAAPAPAKGTPEYVPDPNQEKTKAEWRAEHVSDDYRRCIGIAQNAFGAGLNSASPKDDVQNYANRVKALADIYYEATQLKYEEALAPVVDIDVQEDPYPDIPF